MQKNKNLLIGISILIVVLIIGGGFFFLNKSKSSKQPIKQTDNQDTGAVQTLSASDIGLKFSASPDNKKVQFTVAKLSDIKAISYEITYQADSTAEEKSEGGDATVQRGITGDSKINSGENSYTSPWLDLGSCSRNICRYDTGVTSIDLILKVTKTNNKNYQVEQKLDL